ncbi:AMP-binding protein [Candidatus Woesearchaeota archaeon]|nr:AMP-binding protein [Candidatus Woesearchaeota archaeon]
MRTLSELVKALGRFGKAAAIVEHTDYRRLPTTYLELSSMIERCCTLFAEMKLSRGDRIVLWGPNTTEWIIVFLAAMKMGVITVPLDVRNTTEFGKKIMKEVGATAVFSTRWKPLIHKKTIVLEELSESLPNRRAVPTPPITPRDIAQVIYTSGTTGKPKGVILTHGNIASNIEAVTQLGTSTHTDRNLLLVPLSHTLGMCALLSALRIGASTSISSALSTPRIQAAIIKDQPTTITLVPRILEILTSSIKDRIEARIGPHWSAYTTMGRALPLALRRIWYYEVRHQLASLRHIICGGAALPLDLETFWDALDIPILQGYGLTETSPLISINTPDHRNVGSVGKPIPGVRVRIAEDGEILTKGSHVMQGYYKNATATRAALRDGWLSTGDLGRIDTNGYLTITGRAKDMIKTPSGINVYPQDIEPVLKRIKGVRDCAIIPKKTTQGEEVHAIIILDETILRSPDDIITEANKRLDSSQQILGVSVWPELDFPRTPTHKIRTFKLVEWLAMRSTKRDDTELPASTNRITTLISQATGTPTTKITMTSRLVRDCGLDSIGRAELTSRIESEFQIDLPEDAINATTTARDLETLIKERHTIEPPPYLHWTRHWSLIPLRRVLLALLTSFVRRYARVTVNNVNNIPEKPCIIAVNHASHFDVPTLFSILPRNLRKKTTVTTWAEYFTSREQPLIQRLARRHILLPIMTLLYHTILFPQQHGIRESMRYIGSHIDKGGVVVVFPEGRRTRDGSVGEFKPGIGLLATQIKVPIVPVRITGLFDILPFGARWPRRGAVAITIGKPQSYHCGEPEKIAKDIEQKIRTL